MLNPRRIVLLVLMSMSMSVSGVLAQGKSEKSPVKVDKSPVTVVTKYFDPKRPPADMPKLKANEAAVCVSNFSINAGAGGEVTDQTDSATGIRATVKLERITLQIGCEIVIWLPKKAPQKMVEHEDGHRQITERFYATADQVALKLARPWIDRQVVGTDQDVNSASRRAIESAVQQITAQYMSAVHGESTKVQEAYDRITVHGTNKLTAKQGMEKSFDEYERGRR